MRAGTIMTVAALSIAPAPLLAQGMWDGRAASTAMNNLMMQPLVHQANVARARQRKLAGGGNSSRDVTPATTAYTTSAAVSARVRATVVRSIAKRDGPDAARRMDIAMATGDTVGDWAAAVARSGLRPGTVADPLTAYWILNWSIITGGQPTRTQVLAVRDQFRRTMVVNANFTIMTPATRQEFAETLMINFIIQDVLFRKALRAGDPSLLEEHRNTAAVRSKAELGTDLRTLALTDQGFVPR